MIVSGHPCTHLSDSVPKSVGDPGRKVALDTGETRAGPIRWKKVSESFCISLRQKIFKTLDGRIIVLSAGEEGGRFDFALKTDAGQRMILREIAVF